MKIRKLSKIKKTTKNKRSTQERTLVGQYGKCPLSRKTK